ncbi:MAG: hypothetical protein L0212_12880 [Acidobacteria bacterium]|nr:hypothetical protein [Acidobacteriota bacterium]
MPKKIIVLALAVLGLATFFLPLVLVRAPLVGRQKISGWDAVRSGSEKKSRNDVSLDDALEALEQITGRRVRQEPPLAVRQADSLKITLPLAYLSLLLAGVFAAWNKALPLRLAGAVGLLAATWSVISVLWLSRGVEEMVAAAAGRSGVPLVGRIFKDELKVEVAPEIGLYLLVAALAAALAASLLTADKR